MNTFIDNFKYHFDICPENSTNYLKFVLNIVNLNILFVILVIK